MERIHERFLSLGLHLPDLLLPSRRVELSKWPVIACDQFTSRRSYWDGVSRFVGGAYSTYHLTLPEAYLADLDVGERIGAIHETMHRYLSDGVFERRGSCCVLVERSTPHVQRRLGLVIAVDLERYDYTPGSESLIRATEGTIVERIPPRKRIRSGAPLEFPHIMLLLDDPERSVIEPIARAVSAAEPLYETDLMFGGGRLSGYAVDGYDTLERLASAFESHARKARARQGTEKYLLYAVGDGNHSLATAKAVWEETKAKTRLTDHPARYALVELLNLYDDGLVFHPIHRVLFGVDPEEVLRYLSAEEAGSVGVRDAEPAAAGCFTIGFVHEHGGGTVTIEADRDGTAAGAVQGVLDRFLADHPEASIDYIHGEQEARELGAGHGKIALLLPGIEKSALFPTVISRGVLPRKAFSLGEAEEKRYYMEGRRIVP
jgi:hypothetical protein